MHNIEALSIGICRHYGLLEVAGSSAEWDHGPLSEGLSGGLITAQGHG